MNGNGLKFRRAVARHRIVGLDTAPLIYFIEDVAPYGDLIAPVFTLLENRRLKGVTSTITLAEILTKPFAEAKFDLVDEIKFTLKSFSTLSMVVVDERLAEAHGAGPGLLCHSPARRPADRRRDPRRSHAVHYE